MSLGYDVYEDKRDFQQDGLTGEVKRFVTESMQFPCFIIVSEPEHPVEVVRLTVLRNMSAIVDKYNEEEANSMISVYFTMQGKTAYIGKILPRQVKSFLSLFSNNRVDGYYDKDTILDGDMRYTLSE